MTPSIVKTANRSDAPPLAPTYSHLSIVPVPPLNPTIHLLSVAGQVGTPASTSPCAAVPTAFRDQAANAFANVAACLALGGATAQDVTKLTIFVVGLEPSMRGPLMEEITCFFRVEGQDKQHAPPSTLVGVAALAAKEFLIEIEATAAVAAPADH
jgi:enamine deaminase RidA (YjgF/YER057c/UK114 family)